MVDYIEFQKEILTRIKGILEEKHTVSIEKVLKNNDVELVAVMIRKESDKGAIPTIYLEDFYEMYCAGVSLEDIANNIIAIYRKQNGKVKISIEEFKDFECIKSKIMLKLVNYERNQISLRNTPHKKVLDLAVVFYVLWEYEGERMTATVRNSHLDIWNVDIEELYDIAYENTISKLSIDIRNIREVMIEIYKEMCEKGKIDENLEKEIITEMSENAYPMYVVTNEKRLLGASIILYEQILKYIYEKIGGEYYILPSSIHEIIVVPKINMTIYEMKNMVIEINENEVDYLEVLSDNVYCFDGKELFIISK